MYKLIKYRDEVIGASTEKDGKIISFTFLDPNNTDYQAYLRWLDGYELQGPQWVKTSEGNQPLPADA